MATNLPNMRAKYGEGIGVELLFDFPEIQDNERTYLDSDSAIGDSTLSADGVNFSVGQWLIVGQPGNEKTEIVQIHASTAPTSTVITLATALSFAHNRGDSIVMLDYNQIALEYSTDGTNFNTTTAVNIRADSYQTYMQRSADLSTYSYRFRFYNSSTTLYTAYSAIVLATGFPYNSIGSTKYRALNELGETKGELFNDDFLNDSIQEGRRMADQNPAVFRWSFRTKFGSILGQMLSGQWRVAVPTDLRDANTYKNILSIRIGSQNRPVVYQDRVRFNQNYLNVNHSTIATQQTSGGTTLVLASTHDFDTSGAIYVANNSIGDGFIVVSYTGNNKTTNTLTGVTGINRTVTVGTDVWQRAVFGLPTAYTIDNGFIYFDVPLKIDYDGQDAKIDYYSTIPVISSDSDTFDEPFYDLYTSWLKWKIKYKKANGKIDRDGDTDFKDWISGLGNLIGQETPGQRINFIPDVEGFLSATE